MPNFRLVLEYDGSDFEGWQVQKGDRRTVQGCLAEALGTITGAPVQVTGAGRTDSGVHAEGQVANARIETALGAEELRRALNGNLPRDLAVVAVDLVDDDFDARYAARSKLYVYRVWNGAQRSPLRTRRAMTVLQPLDVGAMARAAGHLEGEHDFQSFQATGSNVKETVRHLFRAEIFGATGGEIRMEFEGSGFLRYMVRNMAGTLIEVGKGWREPDSIPALLEAADRSQAGPTAQARGLTLVRVDYGPKPVPSRGPNQVSTEKTPS
jgi:tRNA pseudouridine38-40 synthase